MKPGEKPLINPNEYCLRIAPLEGTTTNVIYANIPNFPQPDKRLVILSFREDDHTAHIKRPEAFHISLPRGRQVYFGILDQPSD